MAVQHQEPAFPGRVWSECLWQEAVSHNVTLLDLGPWHYWYICRSCKSRKTEILFLTFLYVSESMYMFLLLSGTPSLF